MTDIEKARKLSQLFYVFRKDNTKKQPCADENMNHRDIMMLNAAISMRKDGLVKMSDISDHFHISPAAISQAIRTFEKKGWVERVVLENDRRSVYIKVSDEAKQMMKHVEDQMNDHLTDFLEYLGEEDSIALLRIMEKAVAYGKII